MQSRIQIQFSSKYNMNAIEALADAIMTFEGWHYGTRSWRNRNPGNLRPVPDKIPIAPVDDGGYYSFSSLAFGWSRLIADIDAKFAGSHGLTPQSTLQDLLNIYAPAGDHNNPTEYCKFV